MKKGWYIDGVSPYYTTNLGSAYLGDALQLMKHLPKNFVNLIMTSPPFALRRKKEYGNVEANKYVEWFRDFAQEFKRILRNDGSLVIHIGGSWNKGEPTKNLYQYKLLISLCEEFDFRLAQEFFWYNPAKLPSPAEWVTIRRIRAKDAVDHIWWLSKSSYPRANNKKILKPYEPSMQTLFRNGYNAGLRPSGHVISNAFNRNHGGAIRPNIIVTPNTDSNSQYLAACRRYNIKPHPARYPIGIPELFIEFLTRKGGRVLDPFGGSNVTGKAAEMHGRRWMCFELVEEYLKGSIFRFRNSNHIEKSGIIL